MKERDQKKRLKYKPLKRLIHLTPQEIWSWEIRGGAILIRTPDHKTTYQTDPVSLLGFDTSDFGPGDWEECFPYGIQITPRGILEKIKKLKNTNSLV